MTENSHLIDDKELAVIAYNLFEGLPKASEIAFNNTFGRELFQQSKLDDVIKTFLHNHFCRLPQMEIEWRWLVVISVRLLFARDSYLSDYQHFSRPPRMMSTKDIEESLFYSLTLNWYVDGMRWLLLHRACLPITRSCHNWRLCESSRWAMKEYGEDESWGIVAGHLTHDNPTWTLDDMRQLANSLRKRVLRGDSEYVETSDLHYTDAAESATFDLTQCIADDFYWMMKDEHYVHRSLFRSEREAKRLEFAGVYMSFMKCKKEITRREAFATLTVICTVIWARQGKAWLDTASAIGDTESIMRWWTPYYATPEDWEHIDYIKDIFELGYSTPLIYFEQVIYP